MTWANKKFSLYKKNIQRFADVIIMFFCHVANNKVHNVAFDVVKEEKSLEFPLHCFKNFKSAATEVTF